jgi:hypothetical protein
MSRDRFDRKDDRQDGRIEKNTNTVNAIPPIALNRHQPARLVRRNN